MPNNLDRLKMTLSARRLAAKMGMSWALFLQRLRGYFWSTRLGRFVSKWTGRPVRQTTIVAKLENYHNSVLRPNLQGLTERMLAGRITLAQWQERVAGELKDAYQVNMVFGRGGRDLVTYSDWGRMGSRLRLQYRYLNGFAQEIEAGMLSDAQILARVQQYGRSVRTSYFDGLNAAMVDSDFTEERRVLNPAEHCDDCVGYASEGWQAIGYFPPPGMASVCDGNCACEMEYR